MHSYRTSSKKGAAEQAPLTFARAGKASPADSTGYPAEPAGLSKSVPMPKAPPQEELVPQFTAGLVAYSSLHSRSYRSLASVQVRCQGVWGAWIK